MFHFFRRRKKRNPKKGRRRTRSAQSESRANKNSRRHSLVTFYFQKVTKKFVALIYYLYLHGNF